MQESLENLIKQDPDFAEEKIKSKVSNMFVQILLSMVTGKIQKIDHFVSDNVYKRIENKVNDDIANNRIQLYDELNVANVEIKNVEENQDCFKLYVTVYSKALEYYIDKNSKKFLSGNNSYRTERYTNIELTKYKNAKGLGVVRKCPTCGAIVDVNMNGQCSYCHSIFNLEAYDWFITEMDNYV